MSRLIALITALSIMFFSAIILSSCTNNTNGSLNNSLENENPNDSNTPEADEEEQNPTIAVPEYKDYERGTVDFSKIEYKRPSVSDVIFKFDKVRKLIEDNEISYQEQLDKIYELEPDYLDILTMAAYANILSSKNTADKKWSDEYEYITTEYPAFTKTIEALYVAAANSPFAENFEEDYFGDDLIEDYKDGGEYTDKIVQLMSEEASLESEYSSLSPATIVITYGGITDTEEKILDYYKTNYGDNSIRYIAAVNECAKLYEKAVDKKQRELLVALFKIRRIISDEFGYDSYADFAYKNIYHDYTPEKFENFINGISDYVVPVYSKLTEYVFNNYQKMNKPEKLSRIELINNTYKMLEKASDSLYDMYSYMLQHSLFDIDEGSDTRFEGAFTSYLDSYSAPFIFMSTGGDITDYTTICHEFGHFADYYINGNSETSLDLSEVSSQALEFLSLAFFGDIIPASTLEYLTYYEMENALSVLIFQGFYAEFEHIAYTIPYSAINEENLNLAVSRAAYKIGLNSYALSDVYYVMIPHIFLYPYYVQSYCTSLTVALEIYFMEVNDSGSGFDAYMKLITREEDNLTFEEYIKNAGLTSPFQKDYLKKIADKVHYKILGSHYFKELDNSHNAA
jgi:oligoendopeptidase F